MNTITLKHEFRVTVAREFAVAKMLYKATKTQAAYTRYMQAFVFLTYIDNIEHTIEKGKWTLSS